ncbi:MAG: glycosyltransferase family 2 protein [Pirellulales bacterium]
MTTTRISAVICTYNRCHLLEETIESLVAQSLDPTNYDIIVVDNASTDDTAQVVTNCQRKFSGHDIRLIRENTLGLSHARNAGFLAAGGRYVAYLDDDALATRRWLESGLESFASASTPHPVAVVGPVFPRYPEGKPRWFNDRFETFNLGDSSFRLNERQSFMGGNSMFERSVLENLGGFDPQLGMNGDRLWLGEEVELLMRMRQQLGSKCCVVYDPRVKILHAIPRKKLKTSYVLQRRFLNGRCRYAMAVKRGALQRPRLALVSLAWIIWLCMSAGMHIFRYRSFRSWVTEKGAPIMVHAGMLSANLGCRATKLWRDEPQAASDDAQFLGSKAA